MDRAAPRGPNDRLSGGACKRQQKLAKLAQRAIVMLLEPIYEQDDIATRGKNYTRALYAEVLGGLTHS